MGKLTLLYYCKRRYHCDICNRHFTEPFSLLPKNCRLTTRLCFEAIHLLKSSLNVSNVANQLGISASSIFRRLNDIKCDTPKTLPLVLSIDEFNSVLTTLANWAKYILNSFDCPYTNGYTEGMNNKIKVIKRNGVSRNAYGYRNFDNFRNRIMLSCDTI